MIRAALGDHGIGLQQGFRPRGREVSRLEGFSDAAFAFALTLLVVSLEVPRSFDDLLDVLRGVPAFAACFATLVWVWAAHYKFFRRFGLQDRLTIALNSALLFVVMLYVYPLKFMFTILLGMITGMAPTGGMRLGQSQVGDLFIIYGAGFIAVFGLLALMNLRAYRLREQLGLDERERLLTREEIARLTGVAAVGAASLVMALALPVSLAGLAGLAYALIGVVEFFVAWRYARRREAQCQPGR